ncbi:aminopeptidase N [uncultured Gardnerella sp.]|uniref:aminopeptidase N n=1 Tax=uncultured Gardnerella sp. TaxID=293424 RepID=UPI0025D25DFA|nr:aminopeptidase N [uncultured Gardnerella sp.]
MPGANLTRVEAEERFDAVHMPIHYDVLLDLGKGARDFTSRTKITFDAKAGSSSFLDLIANSVESVVLNGASLDVSTVFANSRIELSDLDEHNVVEVVANCQYSNTGEGLHRSVDPSDGNVYLYTQFEVPDARRVYAVFDQPDLKAVFDFTVDAPESWIVTSNMPVKSSEKLQNSQTESGTLENGVVEGMKRWEFESTPKMSSYLTAVCAGPYAQWHTEYNNEDGRVVPMAMYCRQALKDAFAKDVDYLFDITKKGFAFYAKTWGVPYPYAKYDQIYVPEYNAGAMENIGMVTIRDQYVFESKVTDAYAERRVVTVLHELAHMWFGDYVTMKWWNDLWLNESFAEFTSTLATAEATQWHDAWSTFNSGEKSWALNQDQLPTTHPIVAPINDLNDTSVNFDGITYAKGASVLKQLVAYVGREKFFEGIHNYLSKHAYSNATLADLLHELELTSGRDLKSWSAKWLEKAGINTISTEVEESSDGTISALRLRQSASKEHPVLRAHRLAVGFYDVDETTGEIKRTKRIELDVDGELTQVEEARGLRRPALILVNDDDLTYTKLRFDDKSLEFAAENLYRFKDSLTRSIIWLSLWDMTRDAQFPAERFVELSLKALATERESTTFRYALGQVKITASHYVVPSRQAEVAKHVAHELWQLALAANAGSDEQFQLVKAYLGYGEVGDSEFIRVARGLLDSSVKLEGLDIDNDLRWSILIALAGVNDLSEADIDAELQKRDTTENREHAYQARASRATAEAKDWAWEQALRNLDLTNMQMGAVAAGFYSTAKGDLAKPYVERYFADIDWIWKNRTFHMAEALIEGLYPVYAPVEDLVDGGAKWLEAHNDAPDALRRMVLGNLDLSRRTLMVQKYNASLS